MLRSRAVTRLRGRHLASSRSRSYSTTTSAPSAPLPTVIRGPYEKTIPHLGAKLGAPVLVQGTGKASLFHNSVARDFGTNIVGAVAPGKGKGSTFLERPVYDRLSDAVRDFKPYATAVFVPPKLAADAIIEAVEAEIPLVVSVAEGIPTHDQLRVQAAIRSQSKSRLVGANCPGMIIPSARFKLGIQPLAVHSPGRIGIASRSGTISYELAAQTSQAGLGQSVVFGLGGDPFPGTRTWEALEWMLQDPATEGIVLVGEIGGHMEEEAASVLLAHYAANPSAPRKPIVGFIAGRTAERGKIHGHAGAVWYEESETADRKIACWETAGITMARHIGEVGELVQEEMAALAALGR